MRIDKKWFKYVCLIISAVLCISIFKFEITNAEKGEKRQYYSSENNKISNGINEAKPNIEVEYLGVIPEDPIEGKEFEVTYNIKPEPFQHKITTQKEIVLLLDGSGSMDEKIECNHGKTSSHNVCNLCNGEVKDFYCITHNTNEFHLGFTCKKVNDYCENCKKTMTGNIIKCGENSKTRLEELKEAAIAFINKMKEVENLKVGIVVYSSIATINPISGSSNTNITPVDYSNSHSIIDYESLEGEYFLDISDSRLVTMINNIKALGGTNTGEGLRKAEYLLSLGDDNADRSIIFMSDGLPTFYSVNSKTDLSYYMNSDNSIPAIAGSGNDSNYETVKNSTEYACKIGTENIKNKDYKIFSIGYGLGQNNSEGNKRMQEIHIAAGGGFNPESEEDPNNTFYISAEGAIDSVFEKIADKLINSYEIENVNINLNFSDEIILIDDQEIKIEPIIYERVEDHWYKAKEQTVKFKVKANKSGEMKLFSDDSIFSYVDIQGNLQEIILPNPTINVRAYNEEKEDELVVAFTMNKPGYLIGDEVIGEVTFIHPGNKMIYTDAKFKLDTKSIPDNFKKEKDFDKNLYFDEIESTKSKEYKFIIEDDSYIVSETYTQFLLKGVYEYKYNENKINGDEVTARVNIKRGQIKINVVDLNGRDITAESQASLYIEDTNEERVGEYVNGQIFFDTVPTGNHKIQLKEVSKDCKIDEENSIKVIRVDFEQPIKTEVFIAKGEVYESQLNIGANLIGINPAKPFANDEIIVNYKIVPEDLVSDEKLEGIEETVIYSELNFDIGEDFEYVEGGNSSNIEVAVKDRSIQIKLPGIEYKRSGTDMSYYSDNFNISFKLKVNENAKGTIGFYEANNKNINNIKYTDFKGNEIIKTLNTPIVSIGSEKDVDIKILEIQPADSFKITNKKGHIKTGKEYITVDNVQGTYKVEVEHISMPEFVGKVDKINGKYDIIVIGRYNDYENINDKKNIDQVYYRDYNNSDKWNNDITNRKFEEIVEFIQSGQLVFLDSRIKNIEVNNMKKFTELGINEKANLINHLEIDDITMDEIISIYTEIPDENRRVKFTTTNPKGDDIEAEKGDPRNRKMVFNVEIDEGRQNDTIVDINLYLDFNGDGIFNLPIINNDLQIVSKGELVQTIKNVAVNSEAILLEYQLPSDFIGYLDWKIEIEKSNGIKSYVTNLENDSERLFFRTLTGEKLPIKVLQVAPYESDKLRDNVMGNLNLAPVEDGGNLRFNLLLQQVKEYDIKIEVISMKEFNERVGSVNNSLVLNGNYDMIIFGFADTYNGLINDIRDEAAKELKKYILSGQSVMFTHDTFWDGSSINRIKNFIDTIGQIEKKPTPLGWNTTQSKNVYQTNEALITNYPFELNESLQVRRTHKQWYQLDLEKEEVVPWYTITPYTVTENESIPDYEGDIPTDILDELKRSGLVQAEMEQDDKNILYREPSTLDSSIVLHKENTGPGYGGVNRVNKYDVKNFYYTYSIGNVVFSGTAENTKEKFTPYPEEELKLFVNTIAKAIRGANNAPIITESNIYEGMEIDKYQENFKFAATFTDIDNDMIQNEIYIDNIKVTDIIARINGIEVNEGTNIDAFYESGVNVEYIVPKKYYENKEFFEVKIKAIDNGGRNGAAGAESEKGFKIIPTILPIEIEAKGNNYLVGEELSCYIRLNSINLDKKNLNSIRVILNKPNEGLVRMSNDSPTGYEIEISGEEFNNGNSELEYIFQARESIQGYKIEGSIEYSYSNIGSEEVHKQVVPVDIPINIKEGYIIATIENYSNEELSNNLIVTLNDVDKKLDVGNSIEYPYLTSGEYSISLKGVSSDLMIELIGDNPTVISYDNPTSEYVYNIYNRTILNHGIYEGMGKDDIKIYEYDENENVGREYARGSIVPFAASFNINKNSYTQVELQPGGELNSVQGTPGIFKLITENNKTTLEKIGDMESVNTSDGARYIYRIENTIEEMKIVVIYNYKLMGNETWYKNRITVFRDIMKEARVKVKPEENNSSYLPDLF